MGVERLLMGLVVLAGSAIASAADTRCMYANQFMASGAVSCQAGRQFRCANGTWEATGLECADTTGDEEGLQVDPTRKMPGVGEPAVVQPGVPAP